MKIDLIQITTNAPQIFHRLRWGDVGIACPECGSVHIYNPSAGQIHICADCFNRFSDTSGTIFHSTKLSLSKWLVAIYMFVTQSRGISSYNLSRLIGVSQPTAWKMLTKIRLNIKHDLPHTSTAIIDEVYIGADWSKKPAKDKFKHIEPPKRVWNLQGEELKKYYRGQMMSAASKDKIPVIGISDYNTRSLVLLPFLSQITRSLVRERISNEYSQVSHWVSDDSKLYWWMDEEGINHSICDHTHHIYKSEDGYTSNRLEGVFAHLKRMIRGIYQKFKREYSQGYLNEFAWRWSFFAESTEDKFKRIFAFCT